MNPPIKHHELKTNKTLFLCRNHRVPHNTELKMWSHVIGPNDQHKHHKNRGLDCTKLLPYPESVCFFFFPPPCCRVNFKVLRTISCLQTTSNCKQKTKKNNIRLIYTKTILFSYTCMCFKKTITDISLRLV